MNFRISLYFVPLTLLFTLDFSIRSHSSLSSIHLVIDQEGAAPRLLTVSDLVSAAVYWACVRGHLGKEKKFFITIL